jgi:hypothetical protein
VVKIPRGPPASSRGPDCLPLLSAGRRCRAGSP